MIEKTNKKIAMLNIGGYYNYVVIPDSISPQGVIDLMTADSFKKEYNQPWVKSDNQVEIIFINSSELPAPENQAMIDINDIMAENNRLSRENENLLAKLARLETSKSNDLSVVGVGNE